MLWTGTGRRTKVNDRIGNETRGTRIMRQEKLRTRKKRMQRLREEDKERRRVRNCITASGS